MQQLTDDDLLINASSHHEEKERTIPPDMPSVRQARPDFAYFMADELRYKYEIRIFFFKLIFN